jgi:hypothetical protein
VRTRFAGLVVAGFTAVVVHAYLWPVLPMRQLRASIAAALRATAVSGEIDPWRPAVIARCLDQIARAVETISGIAREINLRIL